MSRKTEVKRITSEEANLIEVLRRYETSHIIEHLDSLIATSVADTQNLLREIRLALKPVSSTLLPDLISSNRISQEDADYLLEEIAKGRNVAIVGAIGSGKTTLLHALICGLSEESRITVIESVEEMDFKVSAPDRNITKYSTSTLSSRELVNCILGNSIDTLVFGDISSTEDALSLAMSLMCGHSVIFAIHADPTGGIKNVLGELCKDGTDNLRAVIDNTDFIEVACTVGEDEVRYFNVIR